MHPHEESLIRAFVAPSRRGRWLGLLASAKRRRSFLDRLNHCRDIDDRYATPLPSNANVVAVLRSHGAPESCYVVSDIPAIDGQELPLVDAIDQVESSMFGTLIGCIPGRLAYYYDECGARRWLLQRSTAYQ
jgi:hypothetical protein